MLKYAETNSTSNYNELSDEHLVIENRSMGEKQQQHLRQLDVKSSAEVELEELVEAFLDVESGSIDEIFNFNESSNINNSNEHQIDLQQLPEYFSELSAEFDDIIVTINDQSLERKPLSSSKLDRHYQDNLYGDLLVETYCNVPSNGSDCSDDCDDDGDDAGRVSLELSQLMESLTSFSAHQNDEGVIPSDQHQPCSAVSSDQQQSGDSGALSSPMKGSSVDNSNQSTSSIRYESFDELNASMTSSTAIDDGDGLKGKAKDKGNNLTKGSSKKISSVESIREGWTMEVKAEAHRQTLNNSSNNLNSSDSEDSRKPRQQSSDDRIKADFTLWTLNGSSSSFSTSASSASSARALSWETLCHRYTGLYKSTLAVAPSEGVYHASAVLECLIRPDVDLKQLMAVVLRIASAIQCTCSIVQRSMCLLERKPEVIASHGASKAAAWSPLSFADMLSPGGHTGAAAGLAEAEGWNHIESQICISKELQQRVLLLVFIRHGKSPEPVYINSSNNSNNSSNHHALLPVSAINYMEEVLDVTKGYLTSMQLSLGSLYSLPFHAVCPYGDLDVHFRVQLQTLFRENMWTSLQEVFVTMDEHIQTFDDINADLVQCMEPIYRHHNIAMPNAIQPRKLSEFALNIPQVNNNSSSHNSSTKTVDMFDEDSNSITTDKVVDDFDLASELHNSNVSINTTNSNGNSNSNSSADQQQQMKGKQDGMVKCLILLSRSLGALQQKFDLEHAARLQQKHDYTVAVIEDMITFRRCLFTFLAFDRQAQTSSLGKTFSAIFTNVEPPQPSSDAKSAVGSSLSQAIIMIADPAAVTVCQCPNPNSNSNPSSLNPVPALASSKPKATADIVRARLESYRNSIDKLQAAMVKGEEDNDRSASLFSYTSSTSSTSTKTKMEIESKLLPFNSVLYYFSCFISTKPSTIYITPYNLYITYAGSGIASSLSILNKFISQPHQQKKQEECFPMESLDSVSIQPTNAHYQALITSQSLKIRFRPRATATTTGAGNLPLTTSHGASEFIVTPVYVDCKRIQQILTDIVTIFREFKVNQY